MEETRRRSNRLISKTSTNEQKHHEQDNIVDSATITSSSHASQIINQNKKKEHKIILKTTSTQASSSSRILNVVYGNNNTDITATAITNHHNNNVYNEVSTLTPRPPQPLSEVLPTISNLIGIGTITSGGFHDTRRRRSRHNSLELIGLPDACLLDIFSFIVCDQAIDMDTFLGAQVVCRRIYELLNGRQLWFNIPVVRYSDGELNVDGFRFLGLKNQGTEGKCFHAYSRREQREYAIKRARVYPDNDGIPYYMMREIAALKKISHPNVCPLEFVHLHKFKLYLFFPYSALTLCDLLPAKDVEEIDMQLLLKKPQILSIMQQLFSAVAYCHQRGIIHRNIKPKHLLVTPGPNPLDPVEGCHLQLADFALARILDHPPHAYTSEVITLWYRPPEILLGQKNYTAAVDLWSCGCIFAELLLGKPLFLGLCEIDQLLQIFFKLGLPAEDIWAEFTSLPHYQEHIFPAWRESRLRGLVRGFADESELRLLERCLQYNPLHRISAEEALQHEYILQLTNDIDINAKITARLLKEEEEKLVCVAPHPSLQNLHKTTLSQYSFFRTLELKRLPLNLTMTRQPFYTPHSRADIMDWLISIMDMFSMLMSSRTVYFAIALIDLYLLQRGDRSLPLARTSELRLVAATCLYIASKCEDVSHIGISNLAFHSEVEANNFNSGDILLMEESVLNVLDFDIYIPTIIDYLHIYLHCVPELLKDPTHACFAKYMAEMCLLHWKFLVYAPSTIAFSICVYTLIVFKQPHYPPSLDALSFFAYEDIYECMLSIQQTHSGMPFCEQTSVYRRYLKFEYHQVAKLPTPPLIPTTSVSVHSEI